jgi:CRP-like cAMP-binding protein
MVLRRDDRGTSNRLLLALPQPVFERLRPSLQPVDLGRRQVLHTVNSPITHLYFIERGLISLVKTMHDGRMIEIGAVGIEGVAGANAILGVTSAVLDSIVHIPGRARRISWATLRAEMARSAALHDLMLRYAHFRISQLAQSAACNRLHSLEQRCCRWLLIAHDSARSDSFPITHEFLAMMLGVQRTGVSLAANILQKAQLIRCGRGRVTIVDRPGLEAATCECYAALRTELDRLFVAQVPHLLRRGA